MFVILIILIKFQSIAYIFQSTFFTCSQKTAAKIIIIFTKNVKTQK